MDSRFRKVTTFFSYCYLLRIPLLIGLILITLPPFAIWGSGRSLLENLFVLTAGNIFWVMIVALILAWSLLVASRVVLLNGRDRFGIDTWMKQDVLQWWHLLLASLPTVSLFVCACVEKNRAFAAVSWWKWAGAGLAGQERSPGSVQ